MYRCVYIILEHENLIITISFGFYFNSWYVPVHWTLNSYVVSLLVIIFGVGPTLYEWYTHVLCLQGWQQPEETRYVLKSFACFSVLLVFHVKNISIIMHVIHYKLVSVWFLHCFDKVLGGGQCHDWKRLETNMFRHKIYASLQLHIIIFICSNINQT